VIELKSPLEIQKMREAGRIVAQALHEAERLIQPGVTTEELDLAIRDFVLARGGELLFYRYSGFPAHSCISINEEVVHGIPSKKRRLRAGDIVSVDVGVRLQGFCSDSAETFPVGEIEEEAQNLLYVCREALERGIAAARPGERLSGISRAIQTLVESRGYSVVRQFVGHGIGRKMHEKPQVPNYVDPGFLKDDLILKPGLVLAIEPMVNAGTAEVETLKDKWTVVTRDRKLSAHFEHTVAITEGGPEVLTVL
jgi:methionyl aminopeptidase